MKVVKWFDEKFEETMLIVLLMILTLVMMAQIIMRYIFRSSLPWGEEVCLNCYILSTFMTIGYCVRKKSALRVEVLVGFLPKQINAFLEIFIELVSAAAYSYFFYGAVQVTQRMYASGQLSTALRMPMWYLYVGVTLGFFMGAVRSVQVVVQRILQMGRRSAT